MKDLSIRKLYYSISEVGKITGLEQYVLRYWETEFEELKPSKNRAGNRIYTNKDIQTILKIKKLLKDEKYTIEGAKKILKDFDDEEINDEIKLESLSKLTENSNGNNGSEFKEKKTENKNPDFHKELLEIKNFLVYLKSII